MADHNLSPASTRRHYESLSQVVMEAVEQYLEDLQPNARRMREMTPVEMHLTPSTANPYIPQPQLTISIMPLKLPFSFDKKTYIPTEVMCNQIKRGLEYLHKSITGGGGELLGHMARFDETEEAFGMHLYLWYSYNMMVGGRLGLGSA